MRFGPPSSPPPPPIKYCCCSLLWCQRSFPQKDFAVKVITLLFEKIATNDKFHGAHLRQLCSEDQRQCSICSVFFNLIHCLDTVILFDVQPSTSVPFLLLALLLFLKVFNAIKMNDRQLISIAVQ